MTHPTVPIRRERTPWHARPAVLRGVVLVLALAVLAQGVELLRVERRLSTLVGRLDDAQALTAMGLGERPGKLLLLTADDLDFSVADLRVLQAQADAWITAFAGRHALAPEQTEMLAGVMASHVTAYGDARIQASLGSLPPEAQDRYFRGLQGRCVRTAELLLGEELGATFAQELAPAWAAWTE